MLPAQPPFPTASNLPFQVVDGSQTSTLISESELGVRVAETRQKPGRSEICWLFPLAPGTVTGLPAWTDTADVICVLRSFKDDKLSQLADHPIVAEADTSRRIAAARHV